MAELKDVSRLLQDLAIETESLHEFPARFVSCCKSSDPPRLRNGLIIPRGGG